MNIHEYQAKDLLRQYDIQTPKGVLVKDIIEAESAILNLKSDKVVVKAQIHAGGRGKAGGVKVAESTTEAIRYCQQILSSTLVTKQTGKEGKKVNKVLIEEGLTIKKELYLGLTLDRDSSAVNCIASESGGMDIEDVAKQSPEKIFTESIDILAGFSSYKIRRLADNLNLDKSLYKSFQHLLRRLYDFYLEKDCELIEINPLLITKEDKLYVLDAKISFDNNALYRHEDIVELRDKTEEDAKELQASEYDLSYISLDGNIGCMVNGAGLAMATMDTIKFFNGEPANFLDVGGSASEDKVKKAFEILVSDDNVEGIFINIFGGIMKCDTIANGVIRAIQQMGIGIPVVIRLDGTNVDQAKVILKESNIEIYEADDIEAGAQKIIELVAGRTTQ